MASKILKQTSKRDRERGGLKLTRTHTHAHTHTHTHAHIHTHLPQAVAVCSHFLQREVSQSVTVADRQTLQLRTTFTDSLYTSVIHSLETHNFVDEPQNFDDYLKLLWNSKFKRMNLKIFTGYQIFYGLTLQPLMSRESRLLQFFPISLSAVSSICV